MERTCGRDRGRLRALSVAVISTLSFGGGCGSDSADSGGSGAGGAGGSHAGTGGTRAGSAGTGGVGIAGAGASSASGGASGHNQGGSMSGSGGANAGASLGGRPEHGGAPSNAGQSGEAANAGTNEAGAGGMITNDPACPATIPTEGHKCPPTTTERLSCSYGDTNCFCLAVWDCTGCPPGGPKPGADCTGYEGMSCGSCDCAAGSPPAWYCGPVPSP
jgi:hypothetical protein